MILSALSDAYRTPSGQPGAPPGGHYEPPARSWLIRPGYGSGKRGPETKNSRVVERREARASSPDARRASSARRYVGCAFRCSTPRPGRGLNREGRPGAPSHRAAERWLEEVAHDNPEIGHSGSRASGSALMPSSAGFARLSGIHNPGVDGHG